MKIMFHVTAEQLMEKFCDCGHIDEQGMKDLMDYLSQNTQAVHDVGDVVMFSNFEGDGYIYSRSNEICLINKSEIEDAQ